MPNGFHSHYCPRCEKEKDCAQITHCRREPTSLCADCVYDDVVNVPSRRVQPLPSSPHVGPDGEFYPMGEALAIDAESDSEQ